MKLYFLEAKKPLTKSYELSESGTINKTNYPNVLEFTSHEEDVADIAQFYRAVTRHAALGHCLLKGTIQKPLVKESRAGSTITDGTTRWITLDFDKAPFATVEEALSAIFKKGTPAPLADVSYMVQYSASAGMPGVQGLNCHVFMMLSHEYHAPYLKAWLMYLNLNAAALSDGLELSAAKTHLSWPLDITTCQNDKLIFIAPPVIGPGVQCTLKESGRYQLVKKDHDVLPISRIPRLDHGAQRAEAHTKKNDLREAEGLIKMRNQMKAEGDHYVITGAAAAVITGGPWVGDAFTYMDLNGGDSRSYWHPNDNYEFIHCFKHPDEWLKTIDLLPGYYAEKERARIAAQSTPITTGELLLTFRDFESSTYWNGTWSPATHKLDIHMASTVKMLDDYRLQHGKSPLDYIPTWRMRFDPHSTVVVDEVNKTVNTYIPNAYMRGTYTKRGASLDKCPTILRTFMHALNVTRDDPMFEHTMNWLACIYQLRMKTQTVLVVSGNEGTGKGVITNHIIAPTLGEPYVARHDGAILEEQYNGWIETALFVSLNEVDITSSSLSKKIATKLRHWINEPTMPIRHMYRGSYEAPSYVNFFMSTNEIEPIHISAGDRRYNIGNYQPEKLRYTEVDIKKIYAEHSAWMEYIMTRKADATAAGAIIESEARQRLIDVSRTSHEAVTHSLQRGDLMALFLARPDMNLLVELHGMNTAHAGHFAAVLQREVSLLRNSGGLTVKSRLTREELHTIFEHTVGNMPETPIKFTQFLRHRNINIEAVKVDGVTVRGMRVQWEATPEQAEEMFEWLDSLAPKKVAALPGTAKAKLKIVG